MEELDAVELEAPFSFTLPQPEKLGIPVLQIKEVRLPFFVQSSKFTHVEVHRNFRCGIFIDDKFTSDGFGAQVSFSYSGKEEDFLFTDVNIGIDMDTRIALLGVNGSGECPQ